MPCCSNDACSTDKAATGRYRTVLWIVLAINAAMFAVEITAGFLSGSSALQADAMDFLGDAANYGVSLFVIGMSLRWRSGAALIKGATMGLFGLWVVANVIWHATHGTVPSWATMGAVSIAAFTANAISAALLYAWRNGDANMRSVWICSRNDVLANIAVLAAAGGVLGLKSGWPDFIVAGIMAALALQGSYAVIRHALEEFRSDAQTQEPSPEAR